MAAVDLHTVVGHFEGGIGKEGFDHRGHQCHQLIGGLAFLRIFRVVGDIELLRHPDREGTAAFGQGAHGQQHAADIRVNRQRIGGRIALRARWRTPLQTLLRVGHGVLVCHFGNAESLHTDREALGVHHLEHGAHTLVHLTDQPAFGVVKVHHAGGGCLDPHLVFNGAAADVIGFAQLAVAVGQDLGDEKEADAVDTCGRVRGTGQHQMDDVVGEVMIACGDEYLGAADAVAAVVLGHGACTQQAEVGAAVGLGETHRPAPFTGCHAGKIEVFQRWIGIALQCAPGAVGQAGIEAEGEVAGADHFVDQHVQRLWQPLAAIFGIEGDAVPARRGEVVVGLLETFRGGDLAVLPLARLFIAAAIER